MRGILLFIMVLSLVFLSGCMIKELRSFDPTGLATSDSLMTDAKCIEWAKTMIPANISFQNVYNFPEKFYFGDNEYSWADGTPMFVNSNIRDLKFKPLDSNPNVYYNSYSFTSVNQYPLEYRTAAYDENGTILGYNIIQMFPTMRIVFADNSETIVSVVDPNIVKCTKLD